MRFQPCDALGGDFYGFAQNRNGSVSYALADVVGHGVGTALTCAAFEVKAINGHQP